MKLRKEELHNMEVEVEVRNLEDDTNSNANTNANTNAKTNTKTKLRKEE